MSEEYLLPVWRENKYICIITGGCINITVGKIYKGEVEDNIGDYVYIKDDSGRGNIYPIGLFKLVSDDREDKINILLDI